MSGRARRWRCYSVDAVVEREISLGEWKCARVVQKGCGRTDRVVGGGVVIALGSVDFRFLQVGTIASVERILRKKFPRGKVPEKYEFFGIRLSDEVVNGS